MAGRSCCRRPCRCWTTIRWRRCRRGSSSRSIACIREAIRMVLAGGWTGAGPALHARAARNDGSWSEEDSATYRAIAQVAVPRRAARWLETLLAAAPFPTDEPLKILELGSR